MPMYVDALLEKVRSPENLGKGPDCIREYHLLHWGVSGTQKYLSVLPIPYCTSRIATDTKARLYLPGVTTLYGRKVPGTTIHSASSNVNPGVGEVPLITCIVKASLFA